MRNTKAFVAIWYVVLTLFATLVYWLTTVPASRVLTAIGLMWILYICFAAGTNGTPSERISSPNSESVLQELPERRPFETKAALLALACVPSAVFVGGFYTGAGPAEVLARLREGSNSYGEFQEYLDGYVDPGTFANLVFISALAFLQGSWMYSATRLLVIQARTTLVGALSLTLMAASTLYPALARGTTFEAFKLGIFLAFVLWMRSKRHGGSLKAYVLQGALLVGGIQFFLFNISSRGARATQCFTRDVCLGETGDRLGPFTDSFAWLYLYFGHGFNYVGSLIDRVWFENLDSFFAGLLPNGLFGANLGYRERMRNVIDMGAMWHPDVALYMANVGLILVLLTCFALGRLDRSFRNMRGELPMIASFLIALQMISFPVGNFLLVALEYQGISLFLILWWTNSKLKNLIPATVALRSDSRFRR